MKKFSQFSDPIVSRLRLSLKNKGMFATGKTSAAINSREFEDGFQITAPDYIENLETGTPPGTPVNLQNLKSWANARNIQIAPAQLAKGLFTRGSQLYRGVDPRFPGKKQSGVITDVINPAENEKLIEKVGKEVLRESVTEFITTIKNAI